MAVGRISGPLLKANLLRNGVNLAFETDLLYLDVINGKIGIKTASPAHELSVEGTTKTTNLAVTTIADIASFTINTNVIASSSDIIRLEPTGTGAVIYQAALFVNNNLKISTNTIETTVNNSDLEIRTIGTGQVNINANVLVQGDIHATGNITADGNITLGDSNTDSVIFKADIASDIIPDISNYYNLGSDPSAVTGKSWKTSYINDIYATNITSDTISVNGINLILPQGNIIYVATTGNDTNSGVHQNNPLRSIKHALLQAVYGDTIYVYPGVYEEITPMTIPAGVNVKGAGIRSVNIIPTVATIDKDVFLINGESTIEDLTILNFLYNSVNNTGYAFRLNDNFTVTNQSPCIRNIAVLTKGTPTSSTDPYGYDQGNAGKGVFFDGSVASITSAIPTILLQSATFITPNQSSISVTNGVRLELVDSTTYFANKGIHAFSGTAGFASTGKTRLKIPNKVGTWDIGNTVSYYDSDATTILGSGVIDSVSGDHVTLTGKYDGFQAVNDRTPKQVFVNGNAIISSTQKKFGTSSLRLMTDGDYILIPHHSDFQFGVAAWTIEAWVYNTGGQTNVQHIFDFRIASTQNSQSLSIHTDGTLLFHTNGITAINGGTVPLDNWTHVAVSKSGTTTKMFINGEQVGTNYTDNNDYNSTQLIIGSRYDGKFVFNGFIDCVRVTKGVARYTSNFSTPTNVLTGDINTVLLLQFNGYENPTMILDDDKIYQDIRTNTGGSAQSIVLVDYSAFGTSINVASSANIYGVNGIHTDGCGVVVNVVGHTFSYVGSGKSSNNEAVSSQSNIVKLNNADVFYTSLTDSGIFNVGDDFSVNQPSGDVLFTNKHVTINSIAGVTFTDSTQSTHITATDITTGNIRINGNTLESVTGNLNITSANNNISLQNDTYITGALTVDGNVSIGGNITIGDQTTDTVTFVAGITSNIVPSTTATYDLGTPILRWDNAFLSRAEIDGVVIDNNTISTTIGDDNLVLTANGTGVISIPSSDVYITQQLTVDGTATLHDLSVTGTITHVGNTTQTGDYTQTGNTGITGNLTVGTWGQFQNIRVDGNVIKTTITNSDLLLQANGTGRIYIPSNNIQITNNLTVNGTSTVNALVVSNTITSNAFSTGDILIDDNYITTTVANNDLELRANGTGRIYIPSNNVQITSDLTVVGVTTLGTINVGTALSPKTITHVGNTAQTGDYTQTGNTGIIGNLTVSTWGQFQNIRVDGNVIKTTITNSDLLLQANGTGRIYIPSNNVQITNNLTVNGTATVNALNITNTFVSNSFSTGDILIDDNYITTTITNNDLELRANGTGRIYIPSNNVQIDQNLTVVGSTTLGTINVGTALSPKTITHIGNTTQTGDYTQTGNTGITGNLTVSTWGQFQNIRVDGNVIKTTITNSDLKLQANGTGRIYIPANNVQINNNLTVNGIATVNALVVSNTITSNSFSTGDILIDDNYITTTITNNDLELRANGTGRIYVPSNNVQIDQNLTVVGSTTLGTINVGTALSPKTITHIGNTTQTGDYTQTGNTGITGNLTVSTWGQFQNIRVDGNIIKTTITNSDLLLQANGTGRIYIPSNNVQITNNLTVNGTATVNAVTVSNTITSNSFSTGDILIDDNYITTTITNNDLELRANGTGRIYVPTNNVQIDQNLTVVNNLTVTTGTTNLKSVDITGMITQVGLTNQTGNYTLTGNIAVTGNITTTGELQLPQITISNNSITTSVTGTDLELQATGTGNVVIEGIKVQDNSIRSITNNTDIVLVPQGTGGIVINSDQSLQIPVGTTLQRPTVPTNGMIRYNTTLTRYEGWNNGYWLQLSGVISEDGRTRILAESAPGTNDNKLYFYANNNLTATIDETKLVSQEIRTANIAVSGNTIRSYTENTNININTTGTGKVYIGNFSIYNNVITNTVVDSITDFFETGTGYVKISGTNGVVIPYGDSLNDRPSNPEMGMMRYNTADQLVEIFNGITWVSAAGTSGGITTNQATELGVASALIFG